MVINIEDFRSIDHEWLPADGLVVLFGPNSAGKTSVLEAAEYIVTQAGVLRSDPVDPEEAYVMGSIAFVLPAVHVEGSDDARLYRSLLCGEYVTPGVFDETDEPWQWLGEGVRDRLKDMSLSDARALLVELMVKAGTAGDADDRRLLAASLLDPAVNIFNADGFTVYLYARARAMPVDARKAALRIASVPDDNDRLRTMAADLVSDGNTFVTRVASGSGLGKRFSSAFPSVIKLDGDPDTLSAELQRALPVIHDALWEIVPKVISEEPLQVESWDEFAMHGDAERSGERYTTDDWLEVRSETGEPSLLDSYNPSGGGEWYRVRHSVLATAHLIEQEANRVAPSFVQDQGKVGIEILPVSLWGGGRSRIRATFRMRDNEPRDLRVLGAGTARWVAAAVRLACHRLERGQQVVTGQDGAVSDTTAIRELIQQAQKEPLSQSAVRLEPSDAAAFYIADEPEAHLHPAALQSVREWLTRLAQTAATVLVATHSTAMLDSSSQLVKRVLVFQQEGSTRLRTMQGAPDNELAQFSEELGITKGELLLMTRLAVFVEGPHDQIILDEWFGEMLRAAGIRIFPVHGVDNMPGLAESEIVASLGMRMAAISDATTIDRTSTDVPETRGDRAVIRLLDEAARKDIKIKVFGLSEPDILYYLDTEICQEAAPAFPGWHEAQQERARLGSKIPWKRFIAKKYGLRLSRSHVRQLARACRAQGRLPAELVQIAQSLTATAHAGNE
jgi:ABC-type Mn2+/Zn2+ transport system ATPase subunit